MDDRKCKFLDGDLRGNNLDWLEFVLEIVVIIWRNFKSLVRGFDFIFRIMGILRWLVFGMILFLCYEDYVSSLENRLIDLNLSNELELIGSGCWWGEGR